MHDPKCSGCPNCNPEMLALLSMSPAEYCRWLTKQDIKNGVPHARYYEERIMLNRNTPPDPYAIALRAAAGKRHSAADQAHLDAAASHLHAAGANGESLPAGNGESLPDGTGQRMSAANRLLRTAAEVVANRGRDNTPPNPYAKGRLRAAEIADAQDPHVDGKYNPRGVPASGYRIALALRQLRAEEEAR